MIGATIRNTANPTRLDAGYKDNVIPGRATATIDCRTLPGQAELFLEQLREVIGPDIEIEYIQRQPARGDHASTVRWSTRWRPRCGPRTRAPGRCRTCSPAAPTPRRSHRLGIRCFGFAPLRLPADLNFSALFHGIDERVPVDGLQFGVRVLDRFLLRTS